MATAAATAWAEEQRGREKQELDDALEELAMARQQLETEQETNAELLREQETLAGDAAEARRMAAGACGCLLD